MTEGSRLAPLENLRSRPQLENRALQERKSRQTLAGCLLGKDASVAAKATGEELAGLPASARRTITYDNRGEFTRHEDVTEKIGRRASAKVAGERKPRRGNRSTQHTNDLCN
jgi:hypothetical protein